MNTLQDLRVYLCGQIENDLHAAGWRTWLTSRLVSIEPTIKVWDPMVKPDWIARDVSDDVAYGYKSFVIDDEPLRHEPPALDITAPLESKGTRCFDANVRVRGICKQLANKCDIMIARISKKFTWGSIDELEIASSRKIPVFMIMPDGLISIYGLAGIVRSKQLVKRYVHFNIDSLLQALRDINSNKIDIIQEDPETWMRLTWVNAASEQ